MFCASPWLKIGSVSRISAVAGAQFAHPPCARRDTREADVQGPLYPFGHGLSYTTFEYSNVSVSPERAAAGATFIVGCDVTNTGARAGEEVVQLYLRDDYSSVVTFDQQLRGFTRVSLAPGETKRVQFELKPEHLMLYDREGKWSIEPGRFTVSVGASSEDLRLRTTFTVTRGDGTAPTEAPVRESKSDPR